MSGVVIIGNGVAGITLARELRKRSDTQITIISEETPHFYSRPALMYLYMGMLSFTDVKPYEDWFWEKNRLRLVHDRAVGIDVEHKRVRLSREEDAAYDTLVVATGSRWNTYGWPGEELEGVVGMTHLSDIAELERLSEGAREAVIVGGGLIGVEMAEMLRSRDIGVTFLVRRSRYWGGMLPAEEAAVVGDEIRRHGVELRLSTELDALLADGAGRVRAVKTKDGEEIPCTIAAMTAGVHPVIDLVEEGPIETAKGILVDNHFATNVDNVYAIGDCAQFRTPLPERKPVEQLWYTAKMHGATLARTLAGTPTEYRPGLFFNSAKFFEIEYQTYGVMPAVTPDEQESFYWEDRDEGTTFRVNFDTRTEAVRSFTLLGLRGRHAVAEQWIDRGTSIRDVMADIGALDFDPEFSRGHLHAMIGKFNRDFPGKAVALRTPKGLFTPVLRSLFPSLSSRRAG